MEQRKTAPGHCIGVRQMPGVEIVALITTFNSNADRVAMHAVRRRLVEAQADREGFPCGLWNSRGRARMAFTRS